jgi:hypothetical protein
VKVASHRELVAGRGLVLAILVALACDPPTPPPAPFYEDEFDVECDGLPCGWEQVGGAPGDVVFERTIHSTVGGITLRGSMTTVRGPASQPSPVTFQMGTIEAQLAARCDVGNSLVVQVVVEAVGRDGGPSGVLDVVEGRVTPAPDWTEPEAGNPSILTARTALMPLSPFGGAAEFEARVVAVTLSKTGAGSCTIDRIALDEVGTTQDRPASACESDESRD